MDDMKSPIYIDFYTHENADCYKIDLPWTRYGKDTRVLCKVSDGYETAQLIAIGVITKNLIDSMKNNVETH